MVPNLFRLSTQHLTTGPFKIVAAQSTTVISIDIMGFLWLVMLVVVLLSFWQLAQVRQAARFSRRRFIGWAVAVGAVSLLHLWIAENVIPSTMLQTAIFYSVALLVGIAALLLGYPASLASSGYA